MKAMNLLCSNFYNKLFNKKAIAGLVYNIITFLASIFHVVMLSMYMVYKGCGSEVCTGIKYFTLIGISFISLLSLITFALSIFSIRTSNKFDDVKIRIVSIPVESSVSSSIIIPVFMSIVMIFSINSSIDGPPIAFMCAILGFYLIIDTYLTSLINPILMFFGHRFVNVIASVQYKDGLKRYECKRILIDSSAEVKKNNVFSAKKIYNSFYLV